MTTIGIDVRLFSQTGVGVYIQNLISHISTIKNGDIQFNLYCLPEDEEKLASYSSSLVIKKTPFRWHSLSEQLAFNSFLSHDNLDLVHFTYFSHPVRYKKPFVITIHDLIPYRFKTGQASTHNIVYYNIKHFFYKYVVQNAIHNSSAIITPTHAVADEIETTFGKQCKEKISVTYEGIREDILKASRPTEKPLTSKPYFLYVGNFYPHKNVQRLIDAFTPFYNGFDLVLVGPNDFFSTKLNTQQKNVVFLHEVSSDKLIQLYKNAQALIHPSLAEGFGLPVLEASYLGCPVIASDIPVFREILSDTYVSFNPKKTEDISEKISNFLAGKQHTTLLSKQKIAEKFSFLKMTQETLEVYKKLI